jgi:pimeloyl-ACP methyl ester carboxylesterase
MAYTAWGDTSAPPVLCVHGLTRTGRDFDALAAHLAKHYYVICPDLPGRGASDWLDDPAHYEPFTYSQALAHLLARIGRDVAWIGTSLGGICAMAVAAAAKNPLRCMVLNDIGPFIPATALQRIKDYAGSPPHFGTITEAEAYLRKVHAPFGALTDAQWAAMTMHSTRAAPDGGLVLHYDPAILNQMQQAEIKDVDLSAWWNKVTVPTLVIRGASSDLLTAETLAKMATDGTETHTVADAGHAPALMDIPTILVIEQFLRRQIEL